MDSKSTFHDLVFDLKGNKNNNLQYLIHIPSQQLDKTIIQITYHISPF